MNPILWNDCETSGLSPKDHAIIQLAAAIEIDGEIVDTCNILMSPESKLVDAKALQVNGRTVEELATFQSQKQGWVEFRNFLAKHGEEGNKAKRYIPAGYNNKFDLEFIQQWHEEQADVYAFWQYLQHNPIDPFGAVVSLWRLGKLDIPDCKLGTVCGYFGIEIQAHDAMSDLLATRELSKRVYGVFNRVAA
jgi:DNA polymerase III subunit epsilon